MNKKEKTKELIINKTKELITKNTDITIKQIADACFINIAAVNYHFGSKDNLISIVMDEIIVSLKEEIARAVAKLDYSAGLQNSLAVMLEIIYRFTLENTGVIRYLFLNNTNQQNSTNILVYSFFSDNDFTRLVLEQLMESMQIKDAKVAYAKYMLLFSAFSIPLFIDIAKGEGGKDLLSSISSKEFRDIYIEEILKLFN